MRYGMKLIRQLLEMAKSSNKRAKQKKNRIKKKSNTPTRNSLRNPVAVAAQTSGAGYHGAEASKEKKGRASRRDAKKDIKNMDY